MSTRSATTREANLRRETREDMSSGHNQSAGDGFVACGAAIGLVDAPPQMLRPAQGSGQCTMRDGCEEVSRRHQRFSREVVEGKRSSLSLIAIPADLAKSSTVTYPFEPFGQPQEW